MKRLSLVLSLLAAAGCTDDPTGVTAPPTVGTLRTLPLFVGQRADIMPAYRAYTAPAQVGYDSLPGLSTSAVAFEGMERLTVYTPAGPGGQVQIFHFLAMSAGQTVVTFRSADGTSVVQDTIDVQAPVPHGAFAQISTGFFLNTCAVTTRGAGFCWGSNLSNMLGSAVEDSAGQAAKPIYDTPMPVTGGLTFATIGIGFQHSCGLTPGGAAYCWGDNFNGQLGNGDAVASSAPVAVAGGLTFRAVSVGVYHTCGLTTIGAPYCWGNNHDGALGNDTSGVYVNSTPVPVSGGLTFQAVGAGWEHSCGLTTAGAAYCWGNNQDGELGTGSTTASSVPVPVSGGLTFVALSVGGYHACGLTRSGAAYCWGSNLDGELGNGTTGGSLVPVAVSGGLAFASISAGDWATCGVTIGGSAYCWGRNGAGQLGNAGTAFSAAPNPSPLLVSGGLTFASISTGYMHTCGVTTGGVAYCWGDNSEGELGDGTTTIQGTPVPVFGP